MPARQVTVRSGVGWSALGETGGRVTEDSEAEDHEHVDRENDPLEEDDVGFGAGGASKVEASAEERIEAPAGRMRAELTRSPRMHVATGASSGAELVIRGVQGTTYKWSPSLAPCTPRRLLRGVCGSADTSRWGRGAGSGSGSGSGSGGAGHQSKRATRPQKQAMAV
jgi:hypothetical protein